MLSDQNWAQEDVGPDLIKTVCQLSGAFLLLLLPTYNINIQFGPRSGWTNKILVWTGLKLFDFFILISS